MWWEHFKIMQPAGHELTWMEFKRAFKDHHIPKGLMVRKMKELLALKQGDDTVYQYAQKPLPIWGASRGHRCQKDGAFS
jgi:hypothetical protein